MPRGQEFGDDGPAGNDFRVGQRLISERHIGGWTVLDVRRGGFGVVYVVRSNDNGKRTTPTRSWVSCTGT